MGALVDLSVRPRTRRAARLARGALELAAAGGLAAFYAAVLALARAPRVDADYRAYYIDRTTTITPLQRARALPYRPGARIEHSETRRALFDGWSGPGAVVRWSAAERATLVLRIDDPARFTGRLELACLYFDTQEVILEVNGTEVARWVGAGEDERRVIRFDPRLLRAGSNELRFDFPGARSPGPHDARKLALALRHVTLR